ncbi:phosphopyruvate hydratase [Candidatus Woesearchaeota archaeon]|nr:phosphopyruvate hydratase [Candidatus Woesearchaeota archaeon]
MPIIKDVIARQILDSRGNPTVEAVLTLKNNKNNKQLYTASASVPSGASTGKHEAVELRDNNPKYYNGKGVLTAVNNINTIIAKNIKNNSFSQQGLDQFLIELDGTANKSQLGANALLAVSMAFARTLAIAQNKPLYASLKSLIKDKSKKRVLPTPYMNIINGGRHAENKLAIQEFMIVPKAKTYAESLRIGAETYHHLKEVIVKKYGKISANIGDEGGFAPNIKSTEEALDLIQHTIDDLGYSKQIKLALDCAASEFYHKGYYLFEGYKINREKLLHVYEQIVEHYPVISIEDPFAEDDFLGFKEITATLAKKKKIQIVGDDLLVTNPIRIQMAIERKLCNALLLKVNQIGTITEALQSAALAKKAGWNIMVSHRSGETNDSFIADLAVALNCGQIKAGAPCRGERMAKYNRLLEIKGGFSYGNSKSTIW